jgi:hypothetical protein
MRASPSSAVLSASLLASLITACGGADDRPRLAEADDAGRYQAVVAATGQVASDAALLARFFAARTDDGCTGSSLDETTLVATFDDCRLTGRSGESLAYSGSVTVLGFTDAANEITSIAIRDLHFTDRNVDLVIDGVITYRRDGEAVDVDVALDVAGQVDDDVTALEIDTHLRRDNGRTSPTAPSTVRVDSIGELDVAGSWGVDQRGGSLSVAGADALLIDFDRPIAGGCFPTLLDGTPSAAVCLDMASPNGGVMAAHWLHVLADRFR